jgi:acetylornithine deacetylase/succinyl-diaminopimelate desuccinylase-like protein
MADHFEEIVHLRLYALETRVDDEAQAVKEHFDEQRRFITESLVNLAARLRREFRTDLAEALASQSAQFRAELAEGTASVRAELAEGLANVRAELGEGLANVRAEWVEGLANVRAELGEELANVRAELADQGTQLRTEIRADLRTEIGGVERRLEKHDLEFTRLEQKIGAQHHGTHLVLQEILRRLPPAA